MPYFTSNPTSPLIPLDPSDAALRSVVARDVRYGFTSRFFEPSGASDPTSVAASDAIEMAPTRQRSERGQFVLPPADPPSVEAPHLLRPRTVAQRLERDRRLDHPAPSKTPVASSRPDSSPR